MKRLPVFVSFILFSALCISITIWAMKLFTRQERPMGAVQGIAPVNVNMQAATSLFGGRPASVAVASNFQLKGVIVAKDPEDSAAILSVDGKPPQSVAQNAEVMPGVTVKEVHAKYVLLSDGGVTKRVDLPEPSSQLRVDMVATDNAVSQPIPAPVMSSPVMPPSTMPPPQIGAPHGLRMPPPMPSPIGGGGG
jgi:general secretion pathway protein C